MSGCPRRLRKAVLTLPLLAVGLASMAPTQDYKTGYHSAGGRTCTYAGNSQLNYPPTSGPTTTLIVSPDCSNVYASLYADMVDCNQWYVPSYYSDWIAAPPNGAVGHTFYAMTSICSLNGLEHRISITGVDVSAALTTSAY
jgi:hypothetical protein